MGQTIRSVGRWIFRIGIITFGVLFLFGLIVYFWFPAPWAGRKASELATAFLEKRQKGWRVEIASIRPFPLGSFELGPLVLRDPTGQALFSLAGVKAKYMVLPLLGNHVSLEDVVIDRPSVFVRKIGDDWNVLRLSALFPPEQPPPPGLFDSIDLQKTPLDQIWPAMEKVLREKLDLPELSIERVRLDEFRIAVDGGPSLSAQLPPISTELTVHVQSNRKNGKLRVWIPEGSRLAASLAPVIIEAKSGLELEIVWKSGTRFEFKGSGGFKSIELATEGDRRTLGELVGTIQACTDLGKGEFTIQSAELHSDPWLNVFSELKIERAFLDPSTGKLRFDLDPEKLTPDLRRWLEKNLGKKMDLPRMKAEGDFSGKLTVATLAELKSFGASKTLPIEMTLSGGLDADHLSSGFLPNGIQLAKAWADFQLTAQKKDAKLHSGLKLTGLTVPPALAGGLSLGSMDVVHEGDLSLKDLRELKISNLSLGILSLGISSNLEGNLSSSVPLYELAPSGEENVSIRKLRESLRGELRASLTADARKASNLSREASIGGLLAGRFELRKDRSDRIEILLSASAEGFSVTLGKNEKRIEVRDLAMDVPIRKTLGLGANPSIAHDAKIWTKAFAENLRPVSPYRGTLKIGSIHTPEVDVSNLDLDAGFDGTNFVLDRLVANLLGGSLWMRGTLLPEHPEVAMSAEIEAAELDMAQLTKEAFQGDAKISFDTRGTLRTRGGEKPTTDRLVDELNLQFHLTKVGEQTLDRLIAFMDPKGENPSFVQARGLLKEGMMKSALKNPKVGFAVSHGILDADIVLPGIKLVDVAIPIRGISVKDLLSLGDVRRQIEGFLPLLSLLSYLEVSGIDDEGNLVFSRGANAQ